MEIRFVVLSAALALSLGPVASHAARAPVVSAALAVQPIGVSDALENALQDAQVACGNCFSSITAWQVAPHATPAQVFASADVAATILDLDFQLPWAGYGEINAQALATKLAPFGQAGLVDAIAAFADPAGGSFHLGAYAWSHPTAPDYCAGETLYLQYFPATGVLFAFRFDSSRDC